MYSRLYERLPDTEAYLERIGLGGEQLLPTRDTLDRLITAQLTHIPFENFDITDLGREIELGTYDLFDKLIVRRRGGYCFELNSLFMSLLEALGFTVWAAAARVLWNKDYFPPLSHRLTVVELDGKRLMCDVGFGGPSPAFSLSIDGDEEISGFTVATGPDGTRLTQREGQAFLMFKAERIDPVDFVTMNEFFSKNKASSFLSKRMANLTTERGSISIDGDFFNERENGGHVKIPIESDRQLEEILKEKFGIVLSLK